VTETEFSAHLLAALNAAGRPTRVERQQAGVVRLEHGGRMHLAPKGAADLSGIVRPHGWRLEVEVKIGARKQTIHQVRRAEFIATFGGVYVLVRWVDGLHRFAVDAMRINVRAAIETVDAALEARWRHDERDLSSASAASKSASR